MMPGRPPTAAMAGARLLSCLPPPAGCFRLRGGGREALPRALRDHRRHHHHGTSSGGDA